MLNISDKKPLDKLLAFQDGSNNKYDFTKLTYPRRLDNVLNQGHYMNFYIYMHTSSAYLTDSPNAKQYTIPKKTKYGINSFSQDSISTSFSNVADGEGPIKGSQDPGKILFSMHYKKITSAISLYVPDDSISFSTRTDWSSESLTDLGGFSWGAAQVAEEVTASAATGGFSGLGNVLTSLASGKVQEAIKTMSPALSAIGGGFIASYLISYINDAFTTDKKNPQGQIGAESFLAGLAGFAVNPQYLFMYKNLHFRRFNYRFVFTPNSEDEAQDVRNIIKMFRFHAAPEVLGITGRFQIAPSVFEIEFKHKSKNNDNIPKIATCILESINVDYSPRGWSTHIDGMPIHTSLDLVFKEVELITKSRIEDGF